MSERDKIIYDLGSNNGDDIPYYLKKSSRVIAVEANPVLAEQIKRRFPDQIKQRRLVVENCVLTVGQEEEVTFYIHKSDHVLSQFPKPDESSLIDYNEVNLPSQNVMNLLQKHGDPFYVKVDLENYDQVILKELFLNGIRPNFISGESHSIEIFSLLVGLGNYRSFNIVDGRKISSVYKKHSIETEVGKELYSFPFHSAGPFGKDIKGDWMTADNFFRLLAFKGLGWRDIHATNEIQPNLEATVSNLKALRYQASYVFNQTKDALRNRAPSFYNTLLRIKRLIAP